MQVHLFHTGLWLTCVKWSSWHKLCRQSPLAKWLQWLHGYTASSPHGVLVEEQHFSMVVTLQVEMDCAVLHTLRHTQHKEGDAQGQVGWEAAPWTTLWCFPKISYESGFSLLKNKSNSWVARQPQANSQPAPAISATCWAHLQTQMAKDTDRNIILRLGFQHAEGDHCYRHKMIPAINVESTEMQDGAHLPLFLPISEPLMTHLEMVTEIVVPTVFTLSILISAVLLLFLLRKCN